MQEDGLGGCRQRREEDEKQASAEHRLAAEPTAATPYSRSECTSPGWNGMRKGRRLANAAATGAKIPRYTAKMTSPSPVPSRS